MDTTVASMERLRVQIVHVNEALAPVRSYRRPERNNALVVRLIGTRMNAKAALVGTTIAFVTCTLEVAAIGVVVSA